MFGGPVKQTDYPKDDKRSAPLEPKKSDPAEKSESDAKPHYLDLPLRESEPGAQRNVALGILCVLLAAVGLWFGHYLAGGDVARTVIASLGAFGIVLLLSGCRVLRQKNGAFLAFGLVALFGAAIPFIEGGFRKLDSMARNSLGNSNSGGSMASAQLPPVTTDTAPPAPPTVDLPETEKPTLSPDNPTAVDDGPARELLLTTPPEGSGKLVRLLEDVKIPLDGRMTILRAGTIAPFKSLADGKVTFLVNGSEAIVDFGLVKFTGATKEQPKDITVLAQEEAVRRYPKIAEADSRENAIFITRKKELEMDPAMKEVFFSDPKWPLVLAEQIADQEGWDRADIASPEEPVADLKPETPADPAGPPVDPEVEKLPEQANPAPPPAPPAPL